MFTLNSYLLRFFIFLLVLNFYLEVRERERENLKNHKFKTKINVINLRKINYKYGTLM